MVQASHYTHPEQQELPPRPKFKPAGRLQSAQGQAAQRVGQFQVQSTVDRSRMPPPPTPQARVQGLVQQQLRQMVRGTCVKKRAKLLKAMFRGR